MSAVQAPITSAPVARRRRKAFFIFFVVLLILATAGLLYWLHERNFESTDDAQVDAHLNPVSARVDGTIIKVYVDDNQSVTVGQPLVDLDPRDFQLAISQARAAVAQAQGEVTAQEPSIPITEVENMTSLSTGEAEVANAEAALSAAERDRQEAQAKVAEAEANNARAQADLTRYRLLISKEEVSQQEFDQVAATAKAQEAMLAQTRAALEASNATVKQRQAQLRQSQSRLQQVQRIAPSQIAIRRATVQSNRANAEAAQAALDQAQLKLTYTKIVAPVAGLVMKRSAEIGAHVSAGQELMEIAQLNDLWVTANFKETQLRRIRPGQSASIHVDALKRDFDGYVESIGATTGAVASVLPPENATGNYVKVVQRIPVRLRFKAGQNGLDRLRPGMSVEPNVQVGG